MAYRIVLRRDRAERWTTNNPVLSLGEPGYETDTGKLKIGNGRTPWRTLRYFGEGIFDSSPETWVDREIPGGNVNGINLEFTLENSPIQGSEHVYLNGQLQDPGEDEDYIIEGDLITFVIPPLSGSKIRVSYRI